MNQSFNLKELKRFCKREDYIEFGLSVPDLESQLSTVYQEIENETFEFEIKKISAYFLLESLPNKIILRKLNDNIKRLYKDEQANRNNIISQLKVLLEETCPYWIIKTDIKSFYESIDRNSLIQKFKDDSMLSYYSMFLLNKLFSNIIITSAIGVPRGMNISATLSEIYMRKFDKWIKNSSGVYYYSRFVDDIVIFTNSLQDALTLLQILNSKLSELAHGLCINKTKTQLFDGLKLEQLNSENGNLLNKDNFLEYLGYRFSKTRNNKEFNLNISIAEKKIRKIKTRLVYSFIDYKKNSNYKLLKNRLKFLTGNYSIKKNAEGNDLRAGIYFNYSQINNYEQLKCLDCFYRKILFSKRPNFDILSIRNKKELKKYCFLAGFQKKIFNSFNYSQMKEIVNCWVNHG